MKILAIHNRYKYRGGEDVAHEAKVSLLTSQGHDVREIILDNNVIGGGTAMLTGIGATWRPDCFRIVSEAIASFRPAVLDVDNFFPLASPSVYYAARSRSVPVIQTLHNYRLLCPGATLFREGRVCEECLGKTIPLPAIMHACYRQSRPQTAAVALMLASHNVLATWRRQVTLFIALTDFARSRFIRGGLPAEQIVVKPNFVATDHGPGAGAGDYVLYVGRLSEEKGIRVLLDAWRTVKTGKLIIVGEGPLENLVKDAARSSQNLSYLGPQSTENVRELMGNARALVFPSLCYEGLPMVIIEAFSRGTPVIANRLGSMEGMIRHGQTGWLLEPGTESELARALSAAQERSPANITMRQQARGEFETQYTAERYYQLLMSIYAQAIALNSQG